MAQIVIINPRFSTSYWGLEHAVPFLAAKAVLPVASLPLLAALTPPEHNVHLIDENVEPIDFDLVARADIVGVTGMNVQRRRQYEILAELKRRGCFTVVGGPWVTVNEADLASRCDVIFVGEAEETWPRFLAEWREGRHQRRYEQSERTDMTTVPTPRFDMLRMKRYMFGSLQFSRGCPFECEFCDIIVTFGRRPRLKSSGQVVAELDALMATGKRYAIIVDDNLIGNKRAIKALLRDVIAWQQARGYPMTFGTEASIDLAEDAELMRLMAEANITFVFVGIESPNEASLKETRKVQNVRPRGGTLLEKVARIQNAGMEVWCGMIVGFDSDDASIFAAQRRFIAQSRIAHVMINLLSAIPRTPLCKRLLAEGRLDLAAEGEDMGSFGTNVVPLRLDRETLFEGYAGLMRDVYTPQAYFDRLDALYLDRRFRPAAARARWLFRNHPKRWLRFNVRLLLEAVAVMVELMRGVLEPNLRREYRRRFQRAVLRRPLPRILQRYAVK